MEQEKLTSKEYFKQLKLKREKYEQEVYKIKYNTPALNLFCVNHEREYVGRAFSDAVDIYSKLTTAEAKEQFSKTALMFFRDLGSEKTKGVLSYYNECENTFNAIKGILMALEEGKKFKEIDELLSDTYENMEIPYSRGKNAFVSLRNNALEVTLPEREKYKKAEKEAAEKSAKSEEELGNL